MDAPRPLFSFIGVPKGFSVHPGLQTAYLASYDVAAAICLR